LDTVEKIVEDKNCKEEDTMHCHSCNYPISHDFKYCPNCNIELKKNCDSCKKIIYIWWKNCPYCWKENNLQNTKKENIVENKTKVIEAEVDKIINEQEDFENNK
jgi:RNA polymerase subunit RPABC4/transcription elongation factor Spt4